MRKIQIDRDTITGNPIVYYLVYAQYRMVYVQ
jgi:hypothetical protein